MFNYIHIYFGGEGAGYFLREELHAILNQIIIHVFVYNFIGGGHQRMYQRWY